MLKTTPAPVRRRPNNKSAFSAASLSQTSVYPRTWLASEGVRAAIWARPRLTSRDRAWDSNRLVRTCPKGRNRLVNLSQSCLSRSVNPEGSSTVVLRTKRPSYSPGNVDLSCASSASCTIWACSMAARLTGNTRLGPRKTPPAKPST